MLDRDRDTDARSSTDRENANNTNLSDELWLARKELRELRLSNELYACRERNYMDSFVIITRFLKVGHHEENLSLRAVAAIQQL